MSGIYVLLVVKYFNFVLMEYLGFVNFFFNFFDYLEEGVDIFIWTLEIYGEKNILFYVLEFVFFFILFYVIFFRLKLICRGVVLI